MFMSTRAKSCNHTSRNALIVNINTIKLYSQSVGCLSSPPALCSPYNTKDTPIYMSTSLKLKGSIFPVK
ncbi:unnamed protein product [Allacma fusca]|uniref:Uncharacterized protein n=1 Tax=Allacma fusca TaxID=39272 RepID=A0A8J2P2P9_9HEXA|nr:unnamed protein product [Allacma fusca]